MVESVPAGSNTCQEYCPLFLAAKAKEIRGLNLLLLANSAMDPSDLDAIDARKKGNKFRFAGQELQAMLLAACSGEPQFYPAITEEFGDLYLCASRSARTVQSMDVDSD